MPVTPLDPPLRKNGPADFADKGDIFMSALPTFAEELTALEANVIAKEASAVASALAAYNSEMAAVGASNATAWVSGTTYAAGNVRWSPITFASYRRKTAGAGALDPSADAANWAPLSTVPPQTGNAGRFLTTDGVNASWGSGGIPLAAYDSRDSLRALSPLPNDQYLVESLGLFRWVAGSTEPDDDETAFATASGVWELHCPHWDLIDAQMAAEESAQDVLIDAATAGVADLTARWPGRVLHGSAVSSITSLAAVTQVSFSGTVAGVAVGDKVLATPHDLLDARISVYALVTAANTVTVYLNNPSSTTATLTTGTFKLTVFRES